MCNILVAEPSEADPATQSIRRSLGIWPSLAATLAFITSFFQLFIFPTVPVAPWGDPVLFLENAKRMLAGQLPYRHYLQFTTPGTEVFYAGLIRICHARAWIPNLTMTLLAALTALIITSIAARWLPRATSLVPALLLIGFVLPNSLYATHHWFSTIAVLAAGCVLIDETTTRRVMIAGLFCGFAGFFTQSTMIASLLALTLFLYTETVPFGYWGEFRIRCLALWASATAIFTALCFYFIRVAGFRQFVFCTIVFPLRYYSAEPYNTWRVYGATFVSHVGVTRLIGAAFVYAALPLTYLAWFVYRRWHPAINQTTQRTERLMTFLGVGMFFAIADAPSLLRLCSVSPFAVLLLALLLREKPAARRFLKIASATALAVALAITVSIQIRWHAFLDTPSGRIAFLDADRFDEFRWTLDHTTSGQPFFGSPPLSFALGLRNPTPVNISTTSDFTRPSEAQATVEALDRSHAPLLVLVPSEYVPSRGQADHMGPFREYLQSHYHLVRQFASGDEGWIRNESW